MPIQLLLAVVLLAASLPATCLPDDAVQSPTWTLRYKFAPDQKLRYRNTESVTLDAMEGENRKVDVTGIEQRRIFTVTSVDDAGAARLTMQYEFVGMKVQTNQFEPVEFDTTMKPDEVPPVFRNTARLLKGSAPRFWISSLGVQPGDQRRSTSRRHDDTRSLCKSAGSNFPQFRRRDVPDAAAGEPGCCR